jgi:hypothetical protein
MQPIRSVMLGQSNTDAAIDALGALSELRVLHLRNTQVSLAGIKKLSAVPKLSEVGLYGDVRDTWLEEMTKLPGLHALTVSSSQVTKKGLTLLASCKELHRLDFDCSFDDTDLAALSGCKQLEILNVYNMFINGNGDGIKQLAELPNLKDVMLSSISFKDAHMKLFGNLKQIRKLAIAGINITDAAVPELSRLTWLESLNVFATKITKAGGDKLRMALPKCTVTTR